MILLLVKEIMLMNKVEFCQIVVLYMLVSGHFEPHVMPYHKKEEDCGYNYSIDSTVSELQHS